MTPRSKLAAGLTACGITLALTACIAFSKVSGTLSGLQGSGLVLTLTATLDGGSGARSSWSGSYTERRSVTARATSFDFDTALPEGSAYAVAVQAQPSSPPQTCSVTHGSGTMGRVDVTDVAIACATVTHAISGLLTGNVPSNADVTITLTETGTGTVVGTTTTRSAYRFAALPAGQTYRVTPSAPGYLFDPASAELPLSDADRVQDFALSCSADHGACSFGCCPKAIALSTNWHHTCAILRGGAVKCWGWNYFGQLGDIPDTSTFSAVAAGWAHTCAIAAGSGAASCWGTDFQGSLGASSDTRSDPSTPIDVSGAHAFSTISAGEMSTCALTADAGTALCWGNNSRGELGDGTDTTRFTPVAVSGARSFSSLSTGWYHTCAIERDTSTLFCWGWNNTGANGVDDSASPYEYAPTAIADTSPFTAVAAGAAHTCAIAAGSGIIKCWGVNSEGQLGDGSTTSRYTSAAIADTSPYSAIATGTSHSCGITADAGTVKCWGNNQWGQLGDNSTISRYVPTAITDTSPYSAIATGMYHTCGITADTGTVRCWGGGDGWGELGDGGSPSAIPVDVQF